MLRRLAYLWVLASLVLVGRAVAVSYTVQVVAVSSEEGAQAFQAYLSDENYPAYLVTVPTEEGYIFRLRVGSFANRAAAAAFAEVMNNSLEGSPLNSSPTPALAEGIPQDLISLEPELLGAYTLSEDRIEVVPWGESFAVRSQPLDARRAATYRLADLSSFDAWRAEPLPDGSIIRVYSDYLWPEAWLIETDEDLAVYRAERLGLLADELGVSASALAAFQFEDADEVPFLILIEQFNPGTAERRLLRGVGQPSTGIATRGPELRWFTDTPDIVISERQALFTPASPTPAAPTSVPTAPAPTPIPAPTPTPAVEFSGEGWSATADGDYARLQDAESARSWRAVAGQPVWSRDNLLLTRVGDEVQVYHFLRR